MLPRLSLRSNDGIHDWHTGELEARIEFRLARIRPIQCDGGNLWDAAAFATLRMPSVGQRDLLAGETSLNTSNWPKTLGEYYNKGVIIPKYRQSAR